MNVGSILAGMRLNPLESLWNVGEFLTLKDNVADSASFAHFGSFAQLSTPLDYKQEEGLVGDTLTNIRFGCSLTRLLHQ